MASEGEKPARARSNVWIWLAIGAAMMVGLVVVLGILATLVVPRVLMKLDVAIQEKTAAELTFLESALEDYAVSNAGRYPESLESLVRPDVNGRTYLEKGERLLDHWGREYLYDPPETGRPHPRVYTYGKDGFPGGSGDDADVDNFTIGGDR